jgi:hypothetical protein
MIEDRSKFDEIVKACPIVFGGQDSYRFECQSGWYEPLKTLFVAMEAHLKTLDPSAYAYNHEPYPDEPLRCLVAQVKEKFGGLRCYMNWQDETMAALIREAELACWKTCEVCGEPGETRELGWRQTLCDTHHDESVARRKNLK